MHTRPQLIGEQALRPSDQGSASEEFVPVRPHDVVGVLVMGESP
jgi:hypothetical protein